MTVEWRCDDTTIDCSYPLRILLTGQANVSHIIIYGRISNLLMIVVPEIIIIQPNTIRTDSISDAFRSDNYPIEIPINRTTDKIFLSMIIPASHRLSLSEVEVFSNGVNIALFEIESLETTTSTIEDSNSTLILGTILGIIIASLLLILALVSSCCIYLFIENKKLKKPTQSRKFIYVNTNQGNELLRSKENHPHCMNGDQTATSTIDITNQLSRETGIYEEIELSRVYERYAVSVEIEKRIEKNQATHTYYNTSENVQNVGTTNTHFEPNDLLPTPEIAIADYEEVNVKDLENKVQ